jgi:thiosulfate dehydrogenase
MRALSIALGIAAVILGGLGGLGARADERPHHALKKAQHGGTVVGLCDGETATEVDVAPGRALSPQQAQAVSDKLMKEWRAKHPEARWDDAVAQNAPPSGGAQKSAHEAKPQPTTSTQAPAATQPHEQTGTYGAYDARDELVWRSETQKFVDEGNRIFHDAKQLGGTIGISCDMCHPNAANTHPETYPKFQVQLQRVALLRDMINWCIENPVKGKALPDDSRTLRALEAYILAQRKGQKLDYGKH